MNGKRKNNIAAYLFIYITLTLLLVPFAGMLWAPTNTTTENRSLSETPTLVDKDGTINIDILSDAGTFFEDHFAYRTQLVSTHAKLYATLGSSANKQVIVGSNGWLYYAGTLPDYLGQTPLTERALCNIAHNISLLQGFAQAQGAQFAFAVAPNKNSLYPANMPSRYMPGTKASNWERLKPYLDEYEINYVDLFDVLGSTNETLYYQSDTHWNNIGALTGGNAILATLGHSTVEVAPHAWVERNDYTGDLVNMIFPTNPGTELATYASGYNDGKNQTGQLWQWTHGQSVEEGQVATQATDSAADMTTGTAATDTLVMFRDSFANALIPYYATAFEQAVFTKMVPYDAGAISREKASHVVVERAERHLSYLAQNAPIMPAPAVRFDTVVPTGETDNAIETKLQVKEDGGYTVISGELDPRLWQEDIQIYLEAPTESGSTRIYEASTISVQDSTDEMADFERMPNETTSTEQQNIIASITSDYGFVVYLPGSRDFSNKTLRVICIQKNSVTGIASFTP